MGDQIFCGCCLTSNVKLVESCKHVIFYEKLFLDVQKVARHLTYICITCHSILKKMSEFHDMMMETQNLLYNKVIPYNLKRQKLQLTITEHLDIVPTKIAIKSEQISNDETGIKIEIENTLDIYFEPKIENNEDNLNNTDNTYQNDLSNIEENIDEHVHLNQEIASDNIDEDIPNLIKRTDGDSYSFDQYIDLDKPKQAVTSKGEVYPYISRTLTGQRFTLPEIDSNDVKLVTVTLKDALAELHKKENSEQFQKLKFKCTKCFIGFNLKNVYEAHMNKHNIKEDQLDHYLICDFCECLILPQYAVTHYSSHFIRYQCIECNKLYTKMSLAKTHYKSAHDKSLRECDLCSFTTKSGRTLRYHKEKKHSGNLNTCDYCGQTFKRKKDIASHILRQHMMKKIKCTHCDKMFSKKSIASYHENNVHSKNTESKRNHMCDYCGKTFKSAVILKTHVRIHTGERPYKCDICDSTFTQSSSLNTHKRLVHLKEKRKKKF